MKFYLTVLVSLLSVSIFSQKISQEYLHQLEDEELLSLFIEKQADTAIARSIALVYLNRAKDQNDTIKIARGYDRMARMYKHEKNLIFIDSAIALTKSINHQQLQ